MLGGRRPAARRPLRASPRHDRYAPPRRDRRALACCALAAVVLAVVLALVLGHAERHRSGTNGVFAEARMFVPAGSTACQSRETLPAGSDELRVVGWTSAAPLVTLRRGGRVLDEARATVDRRAGLIEAPLRPLARDVAGVRVCLTLPGSAVLVRGPTPPGVGSVAIERPFAGSSLAIDYLMRGRGSWW